MAMSDLNIPFLKKRNWRETMQIMQTLFKMRVVSLLLLSSIAGAFLGATGWPGFGPLLLVFITGGMSACGASALNQYIEREKDKKMTRTRKRPLPTGMIDQQWVPIAGINLIVLSVIIALSFRNGMLAVYLAAGAFIYVCVYTLWLKPRTLLNIVVGGAAGSAAVLAGGAAVGVPFDRAVWVLSLVVFLWTPAHFWSLAVLYRDDYKAAEVPMLPTLVSERASAWWVFAHTLPMAISAQLLTLIDGLGWVYGVLVFLFSADMIRRNIQFIYRPTKKRARTFFISSNIYLMIIFLAIGLDVMIQGIVALFS